MSNVRRFGYMFNENISFEAICKGFANNADDVPAKLQQRIMNHIKNELREAFKQERARRRKANRARKGRDYGACPTTLSQVPAELHGLPSNKYGGQQLQRMCGLRGGSYGPVNKEDLKLGRELKRKAREAASSSNPLPSNPAPEAEPIANPLEDKAVQEAVSSNISATEPSQLVEC